METSNLVDGVGEGAQDKKKADGWKSAAGWLAPPGRGVRFLKQRPGLDVSVCVPNDASVLLSKCPLDGVTTPVVDRVELVRC